VFADLQLSIKEKNVEVQTISLPIIYADRIQIYQVLQNIISNAIKFSSSKVPKVSIESSEDDEEWVIIIKDNGIGIRRENLRKVFSIFQRLNHFDKYEGNGIGLSICEKIISIHGGRIWVESEYGHGSHFHFSIPKHNKNFA
ncbi:MAG: ATP-binding protein, partial [Pseudomonadota bacterium]